MGPARSPSEGLPADRRLTNTAAAPSGLLGLVVVLLPGADAPRLHAVAPSGLREIDTTLDDGEDDLRQGLRESFQASRRPRTTPRRMRVAYAASRRRSVAPGHRFIDPGRRSVGRDHLFSVRGLRASYAVDAPLTAVN